MPASVTRQAAGAGPAGARAPAPSRRLLFSAVLVLGSLIVGLFLAEGAVRLLERAGRLGHARRTRWEESYRAGAFRQGDLGAGGFLAEGFRGRVSDEYGRPVEWINNAAGFRSRREYAPAPPPGVARLLVLGDSFVVGYRIGQDDTFGARLERWLDAGGRLTGGAEVLLSAIEHPVEGLRYLETRGVFWRPHAVLVGLTLGNDLGQTYLVLQPDGRYRLSVAERCPAVEPNPAFSARASVARLEDLPMPARCLGGGGGAGPLPRIPPGTAGHRASPFHLADALRAWVADRRERRAPQSIVSTWGIYDRPRLFDGNGLGMYLQAPPPEIDAAYRRLGAVLAGYRRVCARHGIRLAVVVFAQRFQVQPRDWEATVAAYGLDAACFDLAAPNRRLRGLCRRRGIALLDPTDGLAERHARTGATLFMPRGDMHWNAAGHRAVFELIRESVAALLRDTPEAPPPAAPW